jgi:hypothetical protein
MKTPSAFYSLKQVKRLIQTDGGFRIRNQAKDTAFKHFSWRTDKIKKAFLKLQPKHFYKRGVKYDNPGIAVDYYKAYGLMGEDVYIHFRIEEGVLIICSFKRIKRGENI